MRFIAWLLLFQFGFQSLGTLKVYLAFELNHDYIAEALCLQKDIANNTCQGNCYLIKSLDISKEQESQIPSTLPEESLFVFGFSVPILEENQYTYSTNISSWQLGQERFSILSGITSEIFHPPLSV